MNYEGLLGRKDEGSRFRCVDFFDFFYSFFFFARRSGCWCFREVRFYEVIFFLIFASIV